MSMKLPIAQEEQTNVEDGFSALANSADSQAEILRKLVESFTTLEHAGNKVSVEDFMKSMEHNITDTVQKITSIAMHAMQLAFAMEGAIEKLNGIEKFIQRVNKINQETRMLSLNATIESARAGEAGKGFAVVATEVKSISAEINSMAGEMHHQIESIADTLRECQDTLGNVAGIDMTQNITAKRQIDGLMCALLNQNEVTSRVIEESSQALKNISQSINEANANK